MHGKQEHATRQRCNNVQSCGEDADGDIETVSAIVAMDPDRLHLSFHVPDGAAGTTCPKPGLRGTAPTNPAGDSGTIKT